MISPHRVSATGPFRESTFGSRVGEASAALTALGALLFVAAPAQAQQAGKPPAAAVEEVVVTAQKRSENVQDVPISIAAFSAKTLERAGVASPQDLQAIVPGFVTQQRVGSAAPSIRGIGSIDPSFASEGVISTYVDGVYIPALGAGTFGFNNVERIEVLKGPQGTLFGRNSVGGLINVITRTPSHTSGGRIELGYGSYDTVTAKAYVTGGLTPNLAADLAVNYKHQGAGWGHNLDTGAAIGFNRDLGVRSKWLLDLDKTTVTVSFDIDRNKDDSSIGFSPYFPGQNLTVPFAPISTRRAGFYDKTGRGPAYNTVTQGGASLRVTRDLGFADFSSLTSVRRSKQHEAFDQDLTAATLLDIEQTIRSKDFSEELQLSSASGGRLTWIAGLYYLRHESSLDPQRTTSPVGSQESVATQTTDSIAGFVQATAALGPDTHLTAGLRYTEDKQSYSVIPLHLISGPTPLTRSGSVKFPKPTWHLALDHQFTPDVMGYVSYNRGFKSGQWNTSVAAPSSTNPEILDAYEAGVKADLFDHRVRINASVFDYEYKNIQYNRIVQAAIVVANAANAVIRGIDVDTQFAPTESLRMNLGVVYLFEHEYTSFANAQFFVPNPNYPRAPCVNFAPFFGVTPLCSASGDLTGNTIIQSPTVSLNGSVNYDIATPVGDLGLNVSSNYTSKLNRTVNGSMTEPAHTLVNAQARLALTGKPVDLTAWCKNLTDVKSHAFGAAINFGFIGGPTPPRTCGVSAQWRF